MAANDRRQKEPEHLQQRFRWNIPAWAPQGLV